MRSLLVLAIVVTMSGCSIITERKTVTRPFDPSTGRGRLIDAKQRAIISLKRDVISSDGQPMIDDSGRRVTDVVVCAEPSPDALQATAAALGGQASGKLLDGLLNVSGSTAESAASIGLRTQTIQLLRDAYFRLCEGYLNDGIDAIAYDILQRRFQSQIVALLAVEQLTGAVKAQQVAVTTSAASDAGAQAALIARMLEDAEEELLKLQEEETGNAAELENLEKKKTELTAARKAAKEKSDKSPDNTDLKAEFDQADNKVAVNASELEAAGRRRASLEKQIARRKEFIAALEESFGAAAQATVKSSAAGTATFGGDGSMAARSSITGVADAVRAITLNAINQDYEAQVCFETLRFRNNLGQFRNNVNNAFDSAGLPDRLAGNAFLEYCKALFAMQADLRGARVGLVETYASAIDAVIRRVGQVEKSISAEDAATLILALSEAVPTEPGTAFLKRKLEVGGSEKATAEGADAREDSQPPASAEREIQMLNPAIAFAHGTGKTVMPFQLKADAEFGPSGLLLHCADSETPTDEGPKCEVGCLDSESVFDPKLMQCVPKARSGDKELF